MARRAFAACALFACLFATAAHAHRMQVFASVEGGVVRGEAYYAPGGPVRGAKVEVHDPAGNVLFTLATDDTGAFSFTPAARTHHRIICESGDGHRETFTVFADELPETLPEPEGAGTEPVPAAAESTEPAPPPVAGADDAELPEWVSRAVAREVRPLREALARYESRTRFRDILGGIGYVFGVAGVVLLLKTRRRG